MKTIHLSSKQLEILLQGVLHDIEAMEETIAHGFCESEAERDEFKAEIRELQAIASILGAA